MRTVPKTLTAAVYVQVGSSNCHELLNPLTPFRPTAAVGRALLDMPLFLTPEVYINVPLEPT
jgi:hypothetical protein